MTEDPATALDRREREVRRQLQALATSTAAVAPDDAIGRLTRLDAMQQQQLALDLRRRLDAQLLRIDAARRRLAKGEYGECMACGDSIPPRRLALSPETPTCVRCQERAE